MSNILWTSEDAEKATGGKSQKKWQATGVSIDSRNTAAGDLFIALKGDFFDGHDFVKQALEKNVAAALVQKIPEGVSKDAPLLVVDDTIKALNKLGKFSRERTRAKIIGVTGSVGKTSTKEAIKMALETQGKTYATVGNLNNHFGAPLSLSRMAADCEYGVFEMGMNHTGEMAELTKIVRPQVAVITNIEAVHMEFFESLEKIADAKAEIFESMDGKDVAVLNADNGQFERLRKTAEKRGLGKILSFGTVKNADFRLTDFRDTAEGISIKASCMGKEISYHMQVKGRHWGLNSLAVLAVVQAAGGDLKKATDGLAKFQVAKGRGQVHELKVKGGKAILIDDAYNASPASMRAAFEVLSSHRLQGGRTVAALGNMLELGKTSPELHAGLSQDIVANKLDIVFTAGDLMKNLHENLPQEKRGAHCGDSGELVPVMLKEIKPNDVILVKGSNGSKMSKIVEELLKMK